MASVEAVQVHLPGLMADQFGISRSEARRLIHQGAVTLDGVRVEAHDLPLSWVDGRMLTIGTRRCVLLDLLRKHPQPTRTLKRSDWRLLCDELLGSPDDDADARVTLSGGGVAVERYAGTSYVNVSGTRLATDVRIGNVQVLAAGGRVVVVSHEGKFPVTEWHVLYDGPITPKEVTDDR